VQVLFTDTVYAVALELDTLIQDYSMILYSESHNSEYNFDLIMPLFGLRILVKPLHARKSLRHGYAGDLNLVTR